MNQIFLILLSVLSIVYNAKIEYWYIIPVINIILAASINKIVSLFESGPDEEKYNHTFLKFLRYWYPVFMVLVCFKEIYFIMIGITQNLSDNYLILIDKFIFGVNPTEYLFKISHPVITEFFQIIYLSFYLIPMIYVLELYLWHRYREIKLATFMIFLGFYLSFIGYLIVPAIGPRFTIHNFLNLNFELNGIFLTNISRDLINFGESIPKDLLQPFSYAQRDAFPSGHTIIILIITYLSKYFKSNSFYFYLPFSILLIFSTVYLRYHYVIDVLGGIIFALFTIIITRILFRGENFKKD